MRKSVLAAGLALCAGLGMASQAIAQAYPTKPVRVVVTFPPGRVERRRRAPDRAAARREARAAVRRRQQAGRGRDHRRRRGRARRARRLHADAVEHGADQPVAVHARPAALRPDQGLHARRVHRLGAQRVRGAPLGAGEDHPRVHRVGEAAEGPDPLRQRRRRLDRPHRRRAVREGRPASSCSTSATRAARRCTTTSSAARSCSRSTRCRRTCSSRSRASCALLAVTSTKRATMAPDVPTVVRGSAIRSSSRRISSASPAPPACRPSRGRCAAQGDDGRARRTRSCRRASTSSASRSHDVARRVHRRSCRSRSSEWAPAVKASGAKLN